jgi:hypothetical protein
MDRDEFIVIAELLGVPGSDRHLFKQCPAHPEPTEQETKVNNTQGEA